MPRSGTLLLSGLLASTDRLSLPREWFNPDTEPAGITDYRAFVEGIVCTRARSEVFGLKFTGDQLWSLLARLRSAPGVGELSDLEVLEQVFPDPRFVWLRRHGTIAQAVSLWRAGRTDEWWLPPGATPAPGPEFDFEEIRARVGEITRGNERWERWFDANGIEPYRVVYEELDARPVDGARAVLAFAGIESPEDVTIAAQSARQADERNREWIARYNAIASAEITQSA